VIGSWLGFWIAGFLGFSAGGSLTACAVGVAGAALLVAILKAVGIFK